MAGFGAIRREALIRNLKRLGFTGPGLARSTNIWREET